MNTDIQFLEVVLFRTARSTAGIRSRPRFKMQSFQQRSASPRLSFQAPVFTNEQNELQFPPDVDLGDVLHDAVNDQSGDERGAGGIRRRVCAGGFGSRRGIVVVGFLLFRLEGFLPGSLLLSLGTI